jgi:hypothetical protein
MTATNDNSVPNQISDLGGSREPLPTLNLYVNKRAQGEHNNVAVVALDDTSKVRRVQLHDTHGRAILKMSKTKALKLADMLVDAVEEYETRKGQRGRA